MKTILLHNWKAKIASLLLSFAIWYLIDSNLSRNQDYRLEQGPGTTAPDVDPNNPGAPVPVIKETPENTLGYLAPVAPPVAIMMVESRVYRLHWMEFGDFNGSLRQFPGYRVG
jgi:hypothetical protein